MKTPSTETMPVLRDVIRRAAHFDPLVEALERALQYIHSSGNHEPPLEECYTALCQEFRIVLRAARKATR